MLNKYIKFIIAVSLPLLIGFLGSIFTVTSINSWYMTLVKPFFNPPNWVFGPVWTLLYILMGIAFFLVWQKGYNKDTSFAIHLFLIQLILNFFWSFIFFYGQNPFLAFIEILALWLVIAITIVEFKEIDFRTVYLLTPYLLWVSFATVLNFAIFMLN